jgi:hypothetical protein
MTIVLLGETTLQRRLAAIGGPSAIDRYMTAIGLAAVREQKLLVHRKTGNTGRTIRLIQPVTGGTAVTVAGGAGVYLEYGTRPHTITPRAAKALRFAASGGGARLSGAPRVGAAVVFAKVVHHPGTKPYPFALPGAVAAVQASGNDPIVKSWNEAGL